MNNVLDCLPKYMLDAVDLLPKTPQPVILFTRHSLREIVRGIGLAGYDLQLTKAGAELAYRWGEYLSEQSQRQIVHCMSSPIQRCLDTAELMIQGAKEAEHHHCDEIEVIPENLLVEPGSYVLDIDLATPYFVEKGAVNFIDRFVKQEVPGMKHPVTGVLDILELLYKNITLRNATKSVTSKPAELTLAVSHDTILSAILAVISRQFRMSEEEWPEMMEGAFMWFEFIDKPFQDNTLYWIWRGQVSSIKITNLLELQ